MVVAASSFCLSLLLVLPAAAQQPRLDLRAGLLASSTLVEDLLATPALKARFPGLGSAPRARAALAPELEAGATLPLGPRVALDGLLGWQPATLQATDDAGTRDVQRMTVLHALLGLEFAARGPLVVGGGVGMIRYRSAARGLFADGADLAPLVRLAAGGRWPWSGHALTVRALADVHRFGSPLLRAAGGSGGGVFRYGLQLGVVPGGAR
ncbi:MAG: hypothetical protein FIB01_04000 [Gemmatimonadetes bacterium]|nr:hypothetical protein [Gemmatimonadota bacterium]